MLLPDVVTGSEGSNSIFIVLEPMFACGISRSDAIRIISSFFSLSLVCREANTLLFKKR